MDESPTANVERLTSELRKLVGRGVWTMRLLTLPNLYELSRVDDSLDLDGQASFIRTYLRDGIDSMREAVYEFPGIELTGSKLRWALRLLLKFDQDEPDADSRRFKVTQILGLSTPYLQMRRPTSPERELLRLLAVHLVSQSAS